LHVPGDPVILYNIWDVIEPGDIEHMHAGQVEQGVDARTVATRLRATRRRLSHRRGPSVTVAWWLPIPRDLDLPPRTDTPARHHFATPGYSEEPLKGFALCYPIEPFPA
jgi:hypothetical protein